MVVEQKHSDLLALSDSGHVIIFYPFHVRSTLYLMYNVSMQHVFVYHESIVLNMYIITDM